MSRCYITKHENVSFSEEICMSREADSISGENLYPIDPESAAEMIRLLDQDRLMTQAMHGLFSEHNNDFTGYQHILDLACGPGGWVQEVAFANPDIEVTGIDISKAMITYAQQQAQIQHLDNAHFQVMNIKEPLTFDEHSFDLINARLIFSFMPPAMWPILLRECRRILRPGGTIRLTEGEWGFSNSPAYEKIMWLINRALQQAGQSFSPNGYHVGVVPMMSRLLKDAGYQHVQLQPHVQDYSIGTEAHYSLFKDIQKLFPLIQPFILQSGMIGREELEQLIQDALAEMQLENFCTLAFYATAWGQNPHLPL